MEYQSIAGLPLAFYQQAKDNLLSTVKPRLCGFVGTGRNDRIIEKVNINEPKQN